MTAAGVGQRGEIGYSKPGKGGARLDEAGKGGGLQRKSSLVQRRGSAVQCNGCAQLRRPPQDTAELEIFNFTFFHRPGSFGG